MKNKTQKACRNKEVVISLIHQGSKYLYKQQKTTIMATLSKELEYALSLSCKDATKWMDNFCKGLDKHTSATVYHFELVYMANRQPKKGEINQAKKERAALYLQKIQDLVGLQYKEMVATHI